MDILPPITIQADNGERADIEYKSPTDATKAVDVLQYLFGINTIQVTEPIQKIRTSHQVMNRFLVPQHLAWIGLYQSIWNFIEYVMPATIMGRKYVTHLATELYHKLLPQLGCNRNFTLLLRYNHIFILGLGLSDPYLEQSLMKLLLFVTHGI